MRVCKCRPNVHIKAEICPVCESPTVDAEKLRSELIDNSGFNRPKFMNSGEKPQESKIPQSTNKKTYTQRDMKDMAKKNKNSERK